MSGMLNLTDVLQLVIDGLYDRPLPEEDFVVEVHQRVLHVPFDLRNQVYVVNKQHLKEVLADVSPVCKEFSEEPVGKFFVLQWIPVVDVSRGELPLDNLTFVVDYQVQLESVEPSHRTLSHGCPSLHGLVLFLALDVTGNDWRGVYDGYSRAFTQCASLEEQQQMQAHLCLTFHESVVGYRVWKLPAHVLAYIAQVEGLEVSVAFRVKEYQNGHYLAVREPAGAVAMPFARFGNQVFFQLWGKKLAEFVKNTENFY